MVAPQNLGLLKPLIDDTLMFLLGLGPLSHARVVAKSSYILWKAVLGEETDRERTSVAPDGPQL